MIGELATYGGALLGRAMRAAADAHVLPAEGMRMLAELPPEARARLAARLDDPPLPRLPPALDTIGAGAAELAVLAILVAVETDAAAQLLASYIGGTAPGAAIAIGLCELALGPARRDELAAAVAVGSPLRAHHLVSVVEPIDALGRAATVRLAPRALRAFGTAPTALDPEVAGFAVRIAPDAPSRLGAAARAVLDDLVAEVAALVTRPRITDVVLRGPVGSGRGEIAREACRRAGAVALVARADALLAEADPAIAAGALIREALLDNALIIITDWDRLGADERGGRVRSELARATRPVIATSSAESPPGSAARPMIEIEVALPPAGAREALWAETLPTSHVALAPEIASLYRIGVGAIARVASQVALRTEIRGAPAAPARDVAAAIRSEFETDLGTLATRREVSQTWDDLVLPAETMVTIREIIGQHRHRATVLGRWGFARKLGRGTGTTALFSGDPGTGKSMVAGLIARELGLDLYQIDLSRVMSKWLGESEKHLARLFDAAETGHVMLLFDEADALLSRRTADPKSSNDRYANVETNYLLTRLEAFHGLAILTSNLEGSIDPALSRRLSFDLRFGFPDEDQRVALWKSMLPAELPLREPLDLRLLARRFELAGGHIRNIVLRAAYLAAQDRSGDGLAMAHVLRAVESEYADRGILVARGRLSR